VDAVIEWRNQRYVATEQKLDLYTMIQGAWIPDRVLSKHLPWADMFYAATLILFFSYAVWSLNQAIQERSNPPSSFVRKFTQTSFRMPYVSFCFQNAPGMASTASATTVFPNTVYWGDYTLNCFLIYEENKGE
jgi:hypothetical protein